jgi:hypothetical protein
MKRRVVPAPPLAGRTTAGFPRSRPSPTISTAGAVAPPAVEIVPVESLARPACGAVRRARIE